jgi:hypothetical protein
MKKMLNNETHRRKSPYHKYSLRENNDRTRSPLTDLLAAQYIYNLHRIVPARAAIGAMIEAARLREEARKIVARTGEETNLTLPQVIPLDDGEALLPALPGHPVDLKCKDLRISIK